MFQDPSLFYGSYWHRIRGQGQGKNGQKGEEQGTKPIPKKLIKFKMSDDHLIEQFFNDHLERLLIGCLFMSCRRKTLQKGKISGVLRWGKVSSIRACLDLEEEATDFFGAIGRVESNEGIREG